MADKHGILGKEGRGDAIKLIVSKFLYVLFWSSASFSIYSYYHA